MKDPKRKLSRNVREYITKSLETPGTLIMESLDILKINIEIIANSFKNIKGH